MRRALVPLMVGAAVLFGCGGNDREDAQKTVRELLKATADRDADAFCDDLTTEEFLKQTTGATDGDRAREACKQQLKSLQRGDIRLVRVDRTKIKGDEADVRVTLEVQGQEQPRLFHLKKEDGDWRVDGGTQ